MVAQLGQPAGGGRFGGEPFPAEDLGEQAERVGLGQRLQAEQCRPSETTRSSSVLRLVTTVALRGPAGSNSVTSAALRTLSSSTSSSRSAVSVR